MVDVDEQLRQRQYLALIPIVVVALKQYLDHYADKLADTNALLPVILEISADVHEVARGEASD